MAKTITIPSDRGSRVYVTINVDGHKVIVPSEE